MMQVAAVLSQTLSSNNDERRVAEGQLSSFEKAEGFASTLLQLTCNEQVSPEIRQVAAVKLKNFVKYNWDGKSAENNDEPPPLPDIERQQIRDACLSAMFDTTGVYRKQISQTVCLIGKSDFPVKWQAPVYVIAERLHEADMDKVLAALSTFDELVRRYRFETKSEDLWREIIFVLQNTASRLTELYVKLLEFLPQPGQADAMSVPERQAWLEAMVLITEIYLSLVSQDLPEYFEDKLAPWMNGFLELLKMRLPAIEENADATEPNSLDNLKVVICEIVTLFSQRFEEEFMPYMQPFIQNIWQLLVEIDHRMRFDKLVNAALDFLSSICQRPQYAEIFKGEGVLQHICDDVIIKNLTLRAEDVEQFEDEPFEFLKRDVEGSDLHTRRRGASDFVRALGKHFEAEIFQILTNSINACLRDYGENPQQNWAKKDIVYNLVCAMASKAVTARQGATSTSQLINISDFYQQFVRADLLEGDPNSFPILRTDALKYLVLFRNQLQPEFLAECFAGQGVVRFLGSRYHILHHYVGYAVDRIFLVKSPNTNTPILTGDVIPLRPLIDGIFECFKLPTAFNTHYLMKALMRTFNVIDAKTAENAGAYVSVLASMIENAIKVPINPLLSHFIFESLCVLIRKAYTSVAGGLDKYVIPIVELIIPNDVVDFVPYALQIVALLIDQSELERQRGRSVQPEQYLNFFPFLLNPALWARQANVPALTLVFESFIRCFPSVVFGSQYAEQVLGCFHRLITSKANDVYGFKLANAFLQHLESSELLTARNVILPMLNRLQSNRTFKFARSFVLFLCRFAGTRGGASLVRALESIQPGIFLMVTEKILVKEIKDMPQTTTYDEKRVIVIGIGTLIADAMQEVYAQPAVYGELVKATVAVLEAFNAAKPPTPEDEEYETNELEYSDPYCKLSYAQHVDTLRPDIGNIKQFLAQAVLVRAASVRPDSAGCVEASVMQNLQAYLNSA